MKKLIIASVLITAIAGICNVSWAEGATAESEIATVRKVINDSIGWALTKDVNLLYSIVAQDDNFLIINPESTPIIGFAAFKKRAETVWLDPRFKATRFEVKDLKITFSESGTVAWYSCLLDDFAEWDGNSGGWENVRWTGVVEKRQGKWIIVQMHFSFPTDRLQKAPE